MGIRKQLEAEFDYDIVDEFLDHLDIMTEAMEPAIIALENKESRSERINELFRIFHNIKSASGFLKIERTHLLSELAEELMDSVRQNQDSISESFINWLLLINDQFQIWYRQLENDDEEFKDTNTKILNVPEI